MTKMTKTNPFIFLCLLLLPIGLIAQKSSINVFGSIKDKTSGETLPFVNVQIQKQIDSSFVAGTISNENGLFTISDVKPGDYLLKVSYIGYKKHSTLLFIGSNSEFINLGVIMLEEDAKQLSEIVITAQQDAVRGTMDKKTYTVGDNVSQNGGTVLQSMNNLPGVTTENGQVQLRGNNKVVVLSLIHI